MANTFLTDQNALTALSVKWSQFGFAQHVIDTLLEAFEAAMQAKDKISELDDIRAPVWFFPSSIGNEKIPILNNKRIDMIFFCDTVHYEAAELFDVPFATGMGALLENVYALNPGSLDTGDGKGVSLQDAMAPVITDDALLRSFEKEAGLLDSDDIPASVADEIADARYWEHELEVIAEIRALQDEVLGSSREWNNLSDAEKEARLEEFARRALEIMFAPNPAPAMNVEFFDSTTEPDRAGVGGYFDPTTGNIHLNRDICGENVTSVGGLVVHEARHVQQHEQMESNTPTAPADTVTGWEIPYPRTVGEDYWQHPMEVDARAMQNLYGR